MGRTVVPALFAVLLLVALATLSLLQTVELPPFSLYDRKEHQPTQPLRRRAASRLAPAGNDAVRAATTGVLLRASRKRAVAATGAARGEAPPLLLPAGPHAGGALTPPPREPFDPAAIDVVYSYVTDDDATWRAALARAVALEPEDALDGIPIAYRGDRSVKTRMRMRANKFRDWGELRYSMRSIAMYAPWVRHIYVVTASAAQVPHWLNTTHERIRIVHHAELFASDELPTFNSLAIESVLHRIPGLSDAFLYFNNDVLLGRSTALDDFVRIENSTHIFYSDWSAKRPLPACRTLLLEAHARPLDDPAYDTASARTCIGTPLFWDTIIALWAWGTHIKNWSAHVPHLWYRRVALEVEERIGAQLKATRRNRLRNMRSDVSMHQQHEAWLSAAANMSGELRVEEQPLTKSPLYLFVVFTNKQSIAHNEASYGAQLAKIERQKPRFVTIDDDLTDPKDEEVAYHRRKVTALMEAIAPVAAPWEMA